MIDIVIRSYSKDFDWLEHCTLAIRCRARGFRRTLIVVPRQSVQRLKHYRVLADAVVECDDFEDDYLGQQVTKLHADLVTDADYILHFDSDCILNQDLCPEALVDSQGRTSVLFTPHSNFERISPWREPTECFLGRATAFDFMRRQPLIYPRWLYSQLRCFCEARHGCTLREYVLSQGPMGFSEYNALGAFAYAFHPERFNWIEHHSDAYDESLARIYWSWGGLTPDISREIDLSLVNTR